MTVNHGSTLSKEYFLAYINLIMISMNCSLTQAKEVSLNLFFRQDVNLYGKETYARFLEASGELEEK